MLTGCEAETSLAPFPNEGEEPIEVRLHATTFGAGIEVSRATALDGVSQIGMTGGTYQNLTLNYNTSTKALNTTDQSKIYYPLQTETMNIYTYAPYSAEAYDEAENTIRVKSEWHEGDNLDDYITDPIWATTAVTKEQAENGIVSASLSFQHAMSRLQIYLVHDEENVENEQQQYEVHLIILTFDRPQYGTMSMETGEITSAAATEEEGYEYKVLYEGPHVLSPYVENVTLPDYTHTILPGSQLKKISVTLKTSNSDGHYTYNYIEEGTEPPVFEAGKTNKMIINFGKMIDSSNEPSIPGIPDDSFQELEN